MPKSLSDQVVVLMGASSGIGRAAAAAFAARGARVVCAGRNARGLDTLVADITDRGGTASAMPTDITDPAAVRALVRFAEERFGRIDTWVNVAGVSVFGRVEDITDEEFERVLRVNFLGHVHGVRAVLPALRRAGGGSVIGVASVEGVRAVPLHAPYTASKFALRGFYDCLRMELAQEGAPIAVTTILPGPIDTPFFEHSRSKIGALPKPPPPVYAPEIVAGSIVHAATHPRREIPVGGAAVGFFLGQRISPALTDALLSLRRLGARPFHNTLPDNGIDNVDTTVDEAGQVHGNHRGPVFRHSAFTRLFGILPRPGELLTAAVSRVHRAGSRRRTPSPARG
jgi:NAD(P)-dependent dehydrogenase (short-subunit alcohol dehydrogenase family)